MIVNQRRSSIKNEKEMKKREKKEKRRRKRPKIFKIFEILGNFSQNAPNFASATCA